MALASSVLGIVFACTFSAIFPLIGPPVVVLLILTLVANRFLVGYVYGRVGVGQTGGLLHIWMMRRFGTLLMLQPFLLGLVLLSRRFWSLGGVLIGSAVVVVVAWEMYTLRKTRVPGYASLDTASKDGLDRFKRTARAKGERASKDEEGARLVSPASPGSRRPRGSMASSIMNMLSFALAVTPSGQRRGPVPLGE